MSIREGFVHKSGGIVLKPPTSFHTITDTSQIKSGSKIEYRYIVLTETELYWKKTPFSLEVRNKVPVSSISLVRKVDGEFKKHNYLFLIETRIKKGKTYIFSTSSRSDRDQWVDTLERVLTGDIADLGPINDEDFLSGLGDEDEDKNFDMGVDEQEDLALEVIVDDDPYNDDFMDEGYEQGNLELFRLLGSDPADVASFLEMGSSDANVISLKGVPAILFACRLPECETLQTLLDHGANPNSKDPFGQSALFYMVEDSLGLEFVDILLSHDAIKLNIKDSYGTPLLHHAVQHGIADAVERIIDRGANLYVRDKKGRFAFQVARPEMRKLVEVDPSKAPAHLIEEDEEEEAPAVVEETPAVVEEAPAVVEETPAVVEEAPAVVEEAPAVVEEAPTVVEEAPAVVEEPTPEVVPVVDEASKPMEEEEQAPAVVEETPEPSPAMEEPAVEAVYIE